MGEHLLLVYGGVEGWMSQWGCGKSDLAYKEGFGVWVQAAKVPCQKSMSATACYRQSVWKRQ